MEKIIERLLTMASEGASIGQVTQLLASDGTAMLRELMQSYVDRCTAQEQRVVVVGADGVKRSDVRVSARRIETTVGEIDVKRLLYQAPGVPGIAPMDAVLGLPEEKYTHDLRRIVAEESARASFEEVVELVAKHTGGHVPKRQVEELAARAACDFDEFYRSRLGRPEDTDHLLILSFDAKGVAMLHRDLREATRKAAEETPRHLETRRTKGEKPNRKRMAEVATVYTLKQWPRSIADVLHGLRDQAEKAAHRPRPTNKRVWASISHTPQRVIDDAFAEAARRDVSARRSPSG